MGVDFLSTPDLPPRRSPTGGGEPEDGFRINTLIAFNHHPPPLLPYITVKWVSGLNKAETKGHETKSIRLADRIHSKRRRLSGGEQM